MRAPHAVPEQERHHEVRQVMRPLSRTQCARKWVGQVAITAKRVCAPPSETEMWV
jgi:hypothetical protein